MPRYSEPAAEISPRMVSISGRPAATREPKASTRIASVTGHEISSERSIAFLFASLKSDHMPEAPVSATSTPSPPSPASSSLRSSATRTMSLALPAARAWTTAVCPSREIETPWRRRDHSARRRPARRAPAARRRRRRRRRDRPPTRCRSWTTTISALRTGRRTGGRSGRGPEPTPSRSPPTRARRARARRAARGRRGRRDHGPGDSHRPEVRRGPVAEPADRPEPGHRDPPVGRAEPEPPRALHRAPSATASSSA